MPVVSKRKAPATGGGRYVRRRAVSMPRRKKGKNALVRVPRDKLAFPTSMQTKLRYCERIELTPGSSTSSVGKTFRGNGIHDPNESGTGHQPRGFNEFMNIYQTFTVLASSCRASFQYEYYDGPSQVNSGTYANMIKTVGYDGSNEVPALSAVICGIRKASSDFVTDSVANQLEKDKMVSTSLVPTAAAKNLSLKGTTKEFFGAGAVVGATGFSGYDATYPATGDPAEQWKWHVWCGRTADNNAADVVRVVCFVTLEYDVTFTEPKQLTQS